MSTTLSALRVKVRRNINETTAERWTDSVVDAYINEAIRAVQGEIDTANPDFFLRVETFTAGAGSYQAATPTDVLGSRIRSLVCYPDSTIASGLPYKVPWDSLDNVYSNIYVSGIPAGYAYQAGYISWWPLLEDTATFRYIYSQKESTLTNDGDALTRIPDEFADAIAYYATVMVLETIGMDSKVWAALYDRALQNIRSAVTPRDVVTIPQINIDDI